MKGVTGPPQDWPGRWGWTGLTWGESCGSRCWRRTSLIPLSSTLAFGFSILYHCLLVSGFSDRGLEPR